MNRSILKKYAPAARRDFIQAVTDRASYYGITREKTEPVSIEGDVAVITGRAFPKTIGEQRKRLEERIARQGFDQVMEAMAYTWFNRFVALRYMEIHGYFDHGYRVLSAGPTTNHAETTQSASSVKSVVQIPEILEHADAVDLPGLDPQQVIDLKLAGNKDADLYRMLLIAQCNALNKAMPFLFERIDDETELLLPDNLLHSDSLIRTLVETIPEEDWLEVEIIGWLYQFYISEKKAEVIGKVVKSEDIPAATQLFTPNWIVKYLVQNSLGRQWVATYPDSPLKGEMEYYIEPAEQTPEVQEQLKAITPDKLDPEELTLLDPACGSGHILVEAYDLLKSIYRERGYRAKDIPRLILQKNLYGLEIDDRAAQLASLSLMMKARADDRRIFERGVQPQVLSIQESKGLNAKEITEALNAPLDGDGSKGDVSQADVAHLIELFEHGKTFGSLIRVPEKLAAKLPEIAQRVDEVARHGEMFEQGVARSCKPMVEQARLLADKYDSVVTNPPYMGNRSMNSALKDFGRTHFPDEKLDLFAMFIRRSFGLAQQSSFTALVTMQSWMFLPSFQRMRESILDNKTVETLAHLGARAFGSISGEVVQVAAFVCRNCHVGSFRPSFLRLVDGDEDEKKAMLKKRDYLFDNATNDDFELVPGSPIAYWMSPQFRHTFENPLLETLTEVEGQNKTADNDKYLRLFWEVSCDCVGRGKKWLLYSKGGPLRRWFGNLITVVDWSDQARRHYRADPRCRIMDESFWYRPGITWTDITSASLGTSFRLLPVDTTFDMAGPSVFLRNDDELFFVLGLLNSSFVKSLLPILNPTLHVQLVNVRAVPICPNVDRQVISRQVAECVRLAKTDWDSNETSHDFSGNPLLADQKSETIQSAFENWTENCGQRTATMAELESHNDKLILDAFDLTDEIPSTVNPDQITVYHPDREEDIKRLISYAIGCMMGRYSLDKPGLILANQGETVEDYCWKISRSTVPLDSERAISDPESVVLDPEAQPACFGCEKVCSVDEARFVISAYAPGKTELHGRPLIYCPECCDGGRSGYVSWQQPLTRFSVPQALKAEWCEPETLQIFLELAHCFGHRVPVRRDDVKFLPDDDGIIPITEFEWFEDDAANRLEEFIATAWPKETLEENLTFIAESIGRKKSESARDAIRRYLSTGFYKHHLKLYKRRPIYWLFFSGKQRAFQCLVYLHRYNSGTLARMRTEYVIPLSRKIDARIEQLADDITAASSTAHQKKLTKERDKLLRHRDELHRFDETLKHYADQRIELDLDDGVKVNYGKFGNLLADVKAVTGKKPE